MKAFLTIVLCAVMIVIGIFVNKKLSNIELSTLKKDYAKVVAGKAVSDSALITRTSEKVALTKEVVKLSMLNKSKDVTIENQRSEIRSLVIKLRNAKVSSVKRKSKKIVAKKTKRIKAKSYKKAISRIKTIESERAERIKVKKSRIAKQIAEQEKYIESLKESLNRYARGFKSNSPRKVRARKRNIASKKLVMSKAKRALYELKKSYNSIR